MIEFPPAHLPLNEYKAAREQSVFQKFAAYGCRNLDFGVTVETITSRNPPEPDIICNISSYGPAAFELAEIRDERDVNHDGCPGCAPQPSLSAAD